MKPLHSKVFSLNFGFLGAAFVILFAIKHITRNALVAMSSLEVASIFSLLGIFLLLPSIFKKNQVLVFLLMSIFLPLIGIVLFPYSTILKYIVVVIFVAVFLWEFRKIRELKLHYLVLSFLCCLYFVLLIYSSVSQILSPVFLELIVNGKSIPDTLFHAAISNSILYDHAVSTRIHGAPSYNYHWFSHYVFAGLSSLIDLKVIKFYNWVYPIFIMPLFIKYLFILFDKTKKHFKFSEKSDWMFFPGLVVYVMIFFGVGGFPAYLSSESLILAHVYQFIFWIFILKYQKKIVENPNITLAMFLLLMVLLFTKASVGLLTFVVAAYLYFRYAKKPHQYFLLFSISVLFASICFVYFYTIRPNPQPVSLVMRLMNYNSNILSYFSYSVSIFYVLYVFIIRTKKSKLNFENFISNNFIFEEILILSIVSSFVFGMFFARNSGDSLYFASTFVFLNFIVLFLLFYRINESEISTNRLLVVVYTLFFVVFLMTPQFYMIKHNTFNEKREAITHNNLMKQLLLQAIDLKHENLTIISVSPDSNWFYNSQKHKNTTPFILSGISNFPALENISVKQIEAGDYSFAAYKNTYRNCNSNELLMKQTGNLGYENLLLFQMFENKLLLNKLPLNSEKKLK